MKHNIRQVGIGPNNEMVMGGVFDFYATAGVPLADLFISLKKNRCILGIPEFVKEATAGGWSMDTIRARLIDAFRDSYGNEYASVIEKRFDNEMAHLL